MTMRTVLFMSQKCGVLLTQLGIMSPEAPLSKYDPQLLAHQLDG